MRVYKTVQPYVEGKMGERPMSLAYDSRLHLQIRGQIKHGKAFTKCYFNVNQVI